MNTIFLLIQDPLNDFDNIQPIKQESVSVLDLLLNGGFMMIPLFLMWVIAIYIFVERMRTLSAASKTPNSFKDEIRMMVLSENIENAKAHCSKMNTPVARMIAKGIDRIGHPLKNIEASIENIGKLEIYRLEKNLNIMATIAGAAPMLGFLGTVTGMIQAFIAIAQEEGTVSPKLLSSGIYEAMITTAFGLFVGILAYLGYNYLISKVNKVIHTMESNVIDFIDLLQEPKK